MGRKGKKPAQIVDWLGPVPRRPTVNGIGICTGCGWRKRVIVQRERHNRLNPVGPVTVEIGPTMIECPVCKRNQTNDT